MNYKEIDVETADALLLSRVSIEYKWKKDQWCKWPWTHIPGNTVSALFNPGEYHKLQLRVEVE